MTFTTFTAGGAADGGSTGYQSLPVNVWETDEAYHATLMAPGLESGSWNYSSWPGCDACRGCGASWQTTFTIST
jgi:hypothetical protein